MGWNLPQSAYRAIWHEVAHSWLIVTASPDVSFLAQIEMMATSPNLQCCKIRHLQDFYLALCKSTRLTPPPHDRRNYAWIQCHQCLAPKALSTSIRVFCLQSSADRGYWGREISHSSRFGPGVFCVTMPWAECLFSQTLKADTTQ